MTSETFNPMNQLIASQLEAREQHDQNARYCTMATIDPDAPDQPRTRTLVSREITPEYCLLFVNRTSKKGLLKIDEAKVELLYFYPTLMTQYRVRGKLSLLSEEQLKPRWEHKPYGSKLLDLFYLQIKSQSSHLDTPEELQDGLKKLKSTYPDALNIPFPEDALGLLIQADYVETWRAEEDGIHQRYEYHLGEQGWSSVQIVP